MDEQYPTYGKSFSDCAGLFLSDPMYNVRSGHRDVDSQHDVLTLGTMADARAIGKREMRPLTHGHPFCFALQLGPLHEMLSSTKKEEKEDSGGDGCDGSTSEEVDGKKKEVFKVEDAPLHNRPESGNMTTSILSCNRKHTSVSEQAVHFWKEGWLYGDVQSHVNYEGHSKFPVRHQW